MHSRKIWAAAITLGLVLSAIPLSAVNWGTGFDSFRDTCADIGGVLNGNGFGATCSFEGDVVNVPAGSRGWTVDIAIGTVATWQGGSNVIEDVTDGMVVACYNPAARNMDLTHQHCVPAE